MSKFKRLKPSVSGRMLLLFAGVMWIGVGTMLLSLAAGWLQRGQLDHLVARVAVGVVAALLIHHFCFLRIVDKNLRRIGPMEGKRCAFSFMSWKSYIMVAVMVSLGIVLRHSPIPKPLLAVLYIGIGLALILSSVRYLRALIR